MKTTELRIGNFIKYGADTLSVIQFTDRTILLNCLRDTVMNIDSESAEPIPLTEEWLINLGFEKIGQNFRKCEDRGYGLGMTEFVIWFNTNKKTYNIKAINILIGIETVHRLQNVYQSLTGQELTRQKN